MGAHRAPGRPRYGRISALVAALAVTLVAVLGGTGILPGQVDGPVSALARDQADPADPSDPSDPADPVDPAGAAAERAGAPDPDPAGPRFAAVDVAAYTAGLSFDTSLPRRSGAGRRVVYSAERQRVWLVDDAEQVEHTYLVSGTVLDNLESGTYEVFSRSEDAVGIENSGTMKWFVRFTRGPSGAAIGFHDIPVKDGVPLQGVDELGTPQSHGCIRQKRADALVLWDFAPLGTTVVVTR